MPLAPGSLLGPYEIVARLGAGGMGEVYRARDPRLGRDVAIKVLTDEAAKDRDRLRRFVAEAKAASALNHPNILTVHEIGESEGGPYLVTELVDGSTVRQLLAPGPLPVSRALDIGTQAADGIAKAHEAGIVHRDLKPENLMVTGDGFVKILDFGLAKLLRSESAPGGGSDSGSTATGMIVGTAGYLSPEQLRGAPIDSRSDVFALGVVLYEMVTGVNPFQRGSAADTFSAILRDAPEPLTARLPGIPADLDAEVRKALAKSPENRHVTARQLAGELRRVRARVDSGLSETRVVAPPTSRRRTARIALVAGAIVVAAVGGALLSRRSSAMPRSVALPANQLAVAVLPIQNQSGDADLERAGIGKILSDALVQILWDVPGMYVVSPLRLDGVARALGKPLGDTASDAGLARKVSEKAGATAMLTGSLARVGRTYVLSANLTELPSERLRGSFRAESDSSDHLIQELTEKIGETLKARLGSAGGARPNLQKVATGSVEAYAHFVRGKDLSDEGKWKEAILELRKAIEIDPQMASAWSELGCAYSFFGDDANAEAATVRAEQLLDHTNQKERRWIEWGAIWIRTGRGDLYCAEGDKFIHDFPDDRDGYFYTGLGHEYLRKDCEKAVEYYEKAYGVTPNYYPVTKAIVDCRLKLHQKDRALASLKRYLDLPWVSAYGRQQAEWRMAEVRKAA